MPCCNGRATARTIVAIAAAFPERRWTPRASASASTPRANPTGAACTARAPDAGKPGGRTSGEPATTENQNIISSLDVQLVQNLVERCLQLYMNQREVVTLLQQQTKIEPSFTSLVWQKLEEQNPEFFKARLEKALHLHFFLPSRNARRLARVGAFRSTSTHAPPHFRPRTRAHH